MGPGSRPGRRGWSVACQTSAQTHLRDLAAAFARGLPKTSRLLRSEGAGNAGRSMHPQPRMQNKTSIRVSHHGHTGNHPAFPAQWFYGLLRALPGDQACLTPSPALPIADLTPASGRQNDTTWPYASRPRSSRALPTSIASRPAFVTTRDPPLLWDGTARISELIWLQWQAKISAIQKLVVGLLLP